MTKLVAIEKTDLMDLTDDQFQWLITRVKRLTEALEEIKKVGLDAHGKGSDAMCFAAGNCAGLASKALNDLSYGAGIECIEVTEHMNFNLGNAMKYIWRTDHKNGVEDLKKAVWYINREIARLTK